MQEWNEKEDSSDSPRELSVSGLPVKQVTLDLQLQPRMDGETESRQYQSRRVRLSSVHDGGLIIDIKLAGDPPAWLDPTIKTMAELLHLPENWNSYGALPVDPQAVAWAIELLGRTMGPNTPPPTPVPTAHGGIELEWHMGGIDLEVHPAAPDRVYLYYEDHRTGKEEEMELGTDVSPLVRVLAELSRRP